MPYYESDWTYYVRGQSGKVLAEYEDLDEDPTARYVYAGSQRIAMLDSLGNVYYYLNDHLGSAGHATWWRGFEFLSRIHVIESDPDCDFRRFFAELTKLAC